MQVVAPMGRMARTLRRLADDQRGVALIMTAVMFAVLLGFMGLVLDGGRLYYEKRSMQIAADAGAMGGAHELWRRHSDYGTQVRPAVVNDTGLNGYTTGNSTITVNTPPPQRAQHRQRRVRRGHH